MIPIIFGMFVVTFGVRFVLYARAHKVVLPEFMENALRFVPVAVLTAIIVPMILMPDKTLTFDWQNPWLLGSLTAFVVGLSRQQPLLTILSGVAIFFVSKYLFL
uniref:Branched-chain amino acid transport n=1 Tax=uncultured Thiotrichaceae bacterium TaxID=298394 RepID=A0A6S6U6N8_9GAMM|nr:MAG: Branched-chain amino acid transport [uncultured Thiotrichaceae bacterium]